MALRTIMRVFTSIFLRLQLDTLSAPARRLYTRYKWWKLSRKIRREHPYCAVCGTTKNLEVHHICPRHICPDRILDEDNLIVLCHECHLRFGHLGDYEMYNPDIREQAREISEMLCKSYRKYVEDTRRRGLTPRPAKYKYCINKK